MEAEQRKKVKAQHTIPTLEGFLAQHAARGDRVAMQTLERRIETALIRSAEVPERDSGLGR